MVLKSWRLLGIIKITIMRVIESEGAFWMNPWESFTHFENIGPDNSISPVYISLFQFGLWCIHIDVFGHFLSLSWGLSYRHLEPFECSWSCILILAPLSCGIPNVLPCYSGSIMWPNISSLNNISVSSLSNLVTGISESIPRSLLSIFLTS